MLVEPYTPALRAEWDALVGASVNGTFLHERGYMEYHRQRFTDASLVVRRSAGGPVIAIMPANRKRDLVDSHGGLTYGGIVRRPALGLLAMGEVLTALREHLRASGCHLLRYRSVPRIYHRGPADEDQYLLPRLGARLASRDGFSVIDRRHRQTPQSRRGRGVRRARAAGVACREEADLGAFWPLLTQVLKETYEARPVHTLDEIAALRQAYPTSIRLFVSALDERVLAGVLIYETPTVARAQYIAAGAEGRRLAALDLLFAHLLGEVFAEKDFFDFGTSAGPDLHGINDGVLELKESWGARLVARDVWELPVGQRDGGRG